jgi:hypothetical protein
MSDPTRADFESLATKLNSLDLTAPELRVFAEIVGRAAWPDDGDVSGYAHRAESRAVAVGFDPSIGGIGPAVLRTAFSGTDHTLGCGNGDYSRRG